MELNLPIHSYDLRSRPASSSRLVNCYPELLPPGGRAAVLLSRAPGITAWTTVGTGPIRGMYSAHIELDGGHQTYLYVVSGSELYYVDTTGAATLIGDIGTSTRVDFDSNIGPDGIGNLVVVNEPRAYYWNGTTFGEIVDDDFVSRGAAEVEFLDNFLLFREPDSGRFFGADFKSVTSYDALQFASADSNPDDLRAIKAIHRQLIAFGSESGEIFENTGSSGFPFERIINATFEEGCLSGATVQTQDNAAYWVADDYTVRRLQGITPTRVSTHAVEQWLPTVTVSSLDSWVYDQEGHFFYGLTADEGTWVLDITTGEWHERQSYGRTEWTPKYHAQFDGKKMVGCSRSNKVGYIDPEAYKYWTDIQRMEWTYQPVYAQGQRAFHDRLEIVLETGVGLTTGQGSDPKIMLQISNDGGKTWLSMPDKELGALGEREVRAVWHNLGSARERVYRCAVSDPIAIQVTGTLLEVRGGRL